MKENISALFLDVIFCPLYYTIRIFMVGYSAGAYDYNILEFLLLGIQQEYMIATFTRAIILS